MRIQNRPSQTDLDLVALLKRGEMSAMTELYNKYYPVVFQKCLTFTRNDQEAFDYVQEIMIRVIEKINSFKEKSSFSTWLYALTFNYCVDQQRKKKGIYMHDLATITSPGIDLIDDLDNESMEDSLANKAQLLSKMDSDDRLLLQLKYQDNKSIKELQLMYNLSASAVKMRLLRAKSKVSKNGSIGLNPAA